MGITIGHKQTKELVEQCVVKGKEICANTEKLAELLDQTEEYLKEIPSVEEKLPNMPAAMELVRLSAAKLYSEADPDNVFCLTGAFAYFVDRSDLVPDNLSAIGMADDLAVLKMALDLAEYDLNAFAATMQEKPVD